MTIKVLNLKKTKAFKMMIKKMLSNDNYHNFNPKKHQFDNLNKMIAFALVVMEFYLFFFKKMPIQRI